MKKLLLIPLLLFCVTAFGQWTKPQLYTNINTNIRLKTYSPTRMAALLDSLVATMNIGGGGGAFTDLSDVPNSYSGQGSKLVRVNSGATALEFFTSTYATLSGSESLTNKTLGSGTSWSSAPTITDGLTITFNPNGTQAGFNFGSHTADPSVGNPGDAFYNSSLGLFRFNDGNWRTVPLGSGTSNEIAYWSGASTLGSLATATYPSLTELSYVKGVTSAVQTQLGTKWGLSGVSTLTGNTEIRGSGSHYNLLLGDYSSSNEFGNVEFGATGLMALRNTSTYGTSLFLSNSPTGSGFSFGPYLMGPFSDGTSSTTGGIQLITNGYAGQLIIGKQPSLNSGNPYVKFDLTVSSDATGDTYYRNSSGYFTRLPAGTDGHVLTLASGIPSWAAPASGWALTGTSTLTGAVDIVGSSSNTIKHTFASLGTTQTDGAGLHFRNTTAAAAGAQQISPSIVLEGQGWKTNATAASQSVKFSMDVLPVQGAANPTGYFIIRSSINNAAYTAGNGLFLLSSGGDLSLLGGLTITGSASTGRAIVFNGGNGELRADANSTIALRINTGVTAQSSGYFRVYNTNGNYTNTSGENVVQGLEMPFAPTSGTGTLTGLKISGTINQTGGANGNITGVYYNPTTTAVGGTNNAFHATSGNLIMGGATVSTSGVFSFNNTTKELNLNGARLWTDHDTNGKDNHFFGYNAGNTSVTGIDNIGIGPGVLTDVTTGSDNIVVGNLAGNDLQDGSNNVLIGRVSGNALVSGSSNVMIGYGTGELTTGSNNIFIGNSAGNANTSGGSNVVIGVDIDAQSNTASNQLTLQNAIFGSSNSSSGTTVSSGNIGFYATTWGTSASRVISLGNGTAPSTSITDGIQIYAEDVASSSELKVRDEAGNVTTLSPHNFTLIEPSEAGAFSHYSEYTNPETGKREAVNIDMLKLARLLEKLTGEKLVYKKTLE